jgi:hypothetical protein
MNPTLAWLIGWCASAFWLFGSGTWTKAADGYPGWWALTLAWCAAAVVALRSQPPRLSPWAAVPSAAAVATALVWPWPASAIGVLLGLGAIAWAAPVAIVRRVGWATCLVGAAIAWSGLVELANLRFGANLHELPFLSEFFRVLLSFAGLRTAVMGDGVTWPDVDFVHRFTPTLEGLGVYPLLLMTAGALPFLALANVVWRRLWLRFLIVAAAYICARYVVVFAWTVSSGDSTFVWNPAVVWVSFAPLCFVLARLTARSGQPSGADFRVVEPGPSSTRVSPSLAVAAAACVGVAFGWLALCGFDPGIRKQGRVMLDEHHSDWEWSDVELDTRTYGQRTTYNYTSLANHLGRHFRLKINRAPLDDLALREVDVLFIKTPTEAYVADEIEAIDRFVARGGGLLLVGDHTNVFGTSYYLNQIAARYGIEFVYDATYDNDHGGLSRYDAPRIGRHPAIAWLPPFLFATSCSLRGRPWVEPIQTGVALRTNPADYSQPSFFAERDSWRHFPFGAFHQSLAARLGRGRVVAFSDSTVWSNFFVYLPGKPELALGVLEWLNRENLFPHLTALWSACALLGFGAAWALARRARGAGTIPTVLLPGVAFLAAWTPLVDAWVRERHRLPLPTVDYPDVCFYRGNSDYHLPITRLIDESRPTLLTFFNWSQRVGLVPRVSDQLDRSALTADALVVARPRGSLDVASVGELLRRGGRVLVLADRGSMETTKPLLEFGGMRWAPREWNRVSEADRALRGGGPTVAAAFTSRQPNEMSWKLDQCLLKNSLPEFHRAGLAIEGGAPLLVADGGEVLAAEANLPGGGYLLVAGVAELFADDVIGHGNSEPTDAQRELYELEYALWRELLPRAALAEHIAPATSLETPRVDEK